MQDALRYIRNNYIQRKIIKHPDRAEADHIYNYPFPAIEEALANAVYHKSYEIREPIEVRVEDDRIEIVSFPGPVNSVSKEELKEYRIANRGYRNRRIGEFLKELHLTEGRNTGFKKILDAVKKNGSPLPEFETDDSRTYFITRLFVHEAFRENEETEEINEIINETIKNRESIENTPNWSVDGTINETINETTTMPERKAEAASIIDRYSNLSDTEKMRAKLILVIVKEKPTIRISEIVELLGSSKATINRILAELKRLELITREGSNKNGVWRRT